MVLRYCILAMMMICIVDSLRQNVDPPSQFSWGNFNNITYLNYVSDQNFPHVCNSGWAFSTINMLNSRIKIKRIKTSQINIPDIMLSPQVLLSCDELDYGCLGGEPITAIQWIYRNNITDNSCQGYYARGYTNGAGCSAQAKCQICSEDKCRGQYRSKIYGIQNYGVIGGQSAIMNEIYSQGPVACGISISDSLRNYTKGILTDTSGNLKNDHHVTVYGWGSQNGVKYWNVMNSWGASWGESGHFRIVKGTNNLGIESRCFWGSPLDTWTADIRNQTTPNSKPLSKKSKSLTQQVKKYESVTAALPKYLVPSQSALNPLFCQSSWAFAVTTMISDRIYKKSNGKNYIMFSVQNLLNCGVGTCQKVGDPTAALQFIQKFGISEQSCQAYLAKTPLKQNCSAANNCGTCKGTLFKENCAQVKNYKRWKIAGYQIISGVSKMKAQVQGAGPIACGIFVSEKFKVYEGGIFSQVTVAPKVNHYVEIVGWGVAQGKQYWYIRNFWGTAWGQSGLARIQIGSNVLGIESKCFASGQLL